MNAGLAAAVGSLVRGTRLLRDLLLTAAVVMVASPLWFLPWRGAAALGRCYGYAAFFLWPIGRRAGMINLRRAYGASMTRAKACHVIWQVNGSLGQSIAEGLQFARRFKRGEPGWEALYEPEDRELEARLLADPRPKIFVTGHIGSWEVAIKLAELRTGAKGAVVVRRVDNPFLNAMVRRIRLRSASEWIDKRGASFEALDRLRRGESIALLVDENAGRRGVFVDFFGRPASTGKTPALLSLMTGAPIVLAAAVRRPGTAKFLGRLALIEPRAARPGVAAEVELTQRIVRIYEQWVREDPGQWRWIHWRWKSRPDGSEETYSRRDLRRCFRDDTVAVSAAQGDLV